MELISEEKKLGRGFRQQAERNLQNMKEILRRPNRDAQDYLELNHQANMAILSLLAAVLGYIDPSYKPNNYE